MKNISIGLVVLQLFFLISPAFADETTSSEKKKFIVTAYYSPLPDQSFYLKGSYEADIRLNGNGTHGASGKGVYIGMLAAPKTYAFGTKIYLDGLGVGTVDDRGGAIVWSGSRGYDADRLDIWMGHGEEGLRRALSWGKRSITGKILANSGDTENTTLDISRVKMAKISAEKYRKQLEQKTEQVVKIPDIFSIAVTKNTDSEMVKELQIILSELSYYKGEMDGKYGKTLIDAIYDFQKENKLIVSEETLGAGYYGVKTRTKLREVYKIHTENEKKRVEEEARLAIENARELARLAQVEKERAEQKEAQKAEVTLFVRNLGTPKMHEVGIHVRALQQSLKSLGYFEGKDTAIFGEKTAAALIRYQTDKGIVPEEFGKLGKETKIALFKDILAMKEKQ